MPRRKSNENNKNDEHVPDVPRNNLAYTQSLSHRVNDIEAEISRRNPDTFAVIEESNWECMARVARSFIAWTNLIIIAVIFIILICYSFNYSSHSDDEKCGADKHLSAHATSLDRTPPEVKQAATSLDQPPAEVKQAATSLQRLPPEAKQAATSLQIPQPQAKQAPAKISVVDKFDLTLTEHKLAFYYYLHTDTIHPDQWIPHSLKNQQTLFEASSFGQRGRKQFEADGYGINNVKYVIDFKANTMTDDSSEPPKSIRLELKYLHLSEVEKQWRPVHSELVTIMYHDSEIVNMQISDRLSDDYSRPFQLDTWKEKGINSYIVLAMGKAIDGFEYLERMGENEWKTIRYDSEKTEWKQKSTKLDPSSEKIEAAYKEWKNVEYIHWQSMKRAKPIPESDKSLAFIQFDYVSTTGMPGTAKTEQSFLRRIPIIPQTRYGLDGEVDMNEDTKMIGSRTQASPSWSFFQDKTSKWTAYFPEESIRIERILNEYIKPTQLIDSEGKEWILLCLYIKDDSLIQGGPSFLHPYFPLIPLVRSAERYWYVIVDFHNYLNKHHAAARPVLTLSRAKINLEQQELQDITDALALARSGTNDDHNQVVIDETLQLGYKGWETSKSGLYLCLASAQLRDNYNLRLIIQN